MHSPDESQWLKTQVVVVIFSHLRLDKWLWLCIQIYGNYDLGLGEPQSSQMRALLI